MAFKWHAKFLCANKLTADFSRLFRHYDCVCVIVNAIIIVIKIVKCEKVVYATAGGKLIVIT